MFWNIRTCESMSTCAKLVFAFFIWVKMCRNAQKILKVATLDDVRVHVLQLFFFLNAVPSFFIPSLNVKKQLICD